MENIIDRRYYLRRKKLPNCVQFFSTKIGGEYKPFEGCLSKVEVNGIPVDLTNDVIKKGAVMGGCAEAE